jgi:protein transport protein SEC61 subunit gamma and related proteins
MADSDASKKPDAYPPSVEPDEDEDVQSVSTLPEDVVERKVDRAIHEIEDDDVEETRPPAHVPKPPGPEGPGFIERAWQTQYAIEARLKKIGRGKYSRVLKMARKPEPSEFRRAAQITAIGVAVVGLLGFLILHLMSWITALLGVK